MDRRRFLQLGVGATICGAVAALRRDSDELQSEHSPTPPAFSVIPVVGDGKWIWTKPPQGETGYLDPRPYNLSVGIELQGQGNAGQIRATTPVPVDCPEQKLEAEEIRTQGCEAQVREVGPCARQLCVAAPQIAPGQTISAVVRYKATLYKQFHNYRRDQFPQEQTTAADVRKQYLGDSPGIQTRTKEVRQLLGDLRTGEEISRGLSQFSSDENGTVPFPRATVIDSPVLSGDAKHPWDLVQKFAAWIPRNIRPQIGPYTSVTAALENRVGDCEEMAAVLVALCRAAGIPARLVWVPNHNWAEFFLADKDGKGHWIPAHTACYSWFGWTGAHELVLQKGDRFRVPDRGSRLFRLQEDWMQWGGRRPAVRYLAELTPQPPKTGDDPGPGTRRKIATGEWRLVGNHTMDHYARR